MRVIDDWWDGRIDGIYPVSCMRAAMKNAPEDIRQYGDLKTDITRRLAEGDKEKHGNEVYVSEPGTKSRANDQDERTDQSVSGPAGSGNDPGGGGDGFVPNALKSGSDSPSSVPIPLIALGSLALLLLASGAAGLVARRVRAHRAAGGPPAADA